jgi:pantoate--beta-alanine ligase
MEIITSPDEMTRRAESARISGERIALVPTMGYLHEGHLTLMREGRRRSSMLVASIFVNPTQFGPGEDFARYPRDMERDSAMLETVPVDILFAPEAPAMYSPDSQSWVEVTEVTRGLCGGHRPGHFRGVTTVVAKLFNLVLPDVAVFGQKDFQQAAVIRRMVADLNMPVKIVVAPTGREPDGLAMSSRNKYLAADQRAQAVILYHALQAAALAVKKKPVSAAQLKKDLRAFLTVAPLARLDYIEFFDPETLQPVSQVKRGTHMALAVFFGKTRLIDNARL